MAADSPTIPIFLVGTHFLPVERLIDSFKNDNDVTFIPVPNVMALLHQASAFERKVILIHAANANQNKEVISIVQGFGSEFGNQTATLITVTAPTNKSLKRLIGMHQWADILPNEVDFKQLAMRVSLRVKAMRERGNPKKKAFAEATAGSSQGPGSTAASGAAGGGDKSEKAKDNSVVFLKGKGTNSGQRDSTTVAVAGKNEPAKSTTVKAQTLVTPEPPTVVSGKVSAANAEAFDAILNRPIFAPISEQQEIASLMRECHQTKTPISLFDEKMSQKGTVRVTAVNENGKIIDVVQAAGVDMESVGRALKDGLLGNFNLRRGRIFFRSDSYQFSGPVGRIVLPGTFYEVQRRSNIRLPMGPNRLLHVACIEGEPPSARSFQIHDLSAQGLCILVDEEITKTWQVNGVLLKDITFKIDKREISVRAAEVRHVMPHKRAEAESAPGKVMCRVGLKFQDISARDHCYLNMYVYRESQIYLDQLFNVEKAPTNKAG